MRQPTRKYYSKSFNSKNDDDEKIIGSFVVKEMIEVDGRDDLGVLKIELMVKRLSLRLE